MIFSLYRNRIINDTDIKIKGVTRVTCTKFYNIRFCYYANDMSNVSQRLFSLLFVDGRSVFTIVKYVRQLIVIINNELGKCNC